MGTLRGLALALALVACADTVSAVGDFIVSNHTTAVARCLAEEPTSTHCTGHYYGGQSGAPDALSQTGVGNNTWQCGLTGGTHPRSGYCHLSSGACPAGWQLQVDGTCLKLCPTGQTWDLQLRQCVDGCQPTGDAPFVGMHWDTVACRWVWDVCVSENPQISVAGWYSAGTQGCIYGCIHSAVYATASTTEFRSGNMPCTPDYLPPPENPEECRPDQVPGPLGYGCGCVEGQIELNGACVVPPVECPPPSVLESGVCRLPPSEPECPAGTTLVNGQCVQEPEPPSCPPGTELVAGECVDPEPPEPVCPPGSTLVGETCVLDDPPELECPAGSELVNGACVVPPEDLPPVECPVGSVMIGGSCVWEAPPDPGCPVGSVLVGGACQFPPPRVECPVGSTLTGGSCVWDDPPTMRCPTGSTLVGNECVLDGPPPVECPDGTTLDGGVCKAGPPVVQCPPDFNLESGACVWDGGAGDGFTSPGGIGADVPSGSGWLPPLQRLQARIQASELGSLASSMGEGWGTGGSCPFGTSVSVLGASISFAYFCELWESISGVLTAAALVLWGLLAIRLLLTA